MEEKQVLLSIIRHIIASIVHLNPFSHYRTWISYETHGGGEIQPHTFRPRPDCMTHFNVNVIAILISRATEPLHFEFSLLSKLVCVCGMIFKICTYEHKQLQANTFFVLSRKVRLYTFLDAWTKIATSREQICACLTRILDLRLSLQLPFNGIKCFLMTFYLILMLKNDFV